MFRDCWARVFALLDVRPVPAEYLPVAEDRMVVLGRYEGTEGGRRFTSQAGQRHDGDARPGDPAVPQIS